MGYIVDTYEKLSNILNGDIDELDVVTKTLNENDSTINILSEVFRNKCFIRYDLMGVIDMIKDCCHFDFFKIKMINSLISKEFDVDLMKGLYEILLSYRGNEHTKVYVNDNETSIVPIPFHLNNDEYILYSFNKYMVDRVDIELDNDIRVAELLLYNNLED